MFRRFKSPPYGLGGSSQLKFRRILSHLSDALTLAVLPGRFWEIQHHRSDHRYPVTSPKELPSAKGSSLPVKASACNQIEIKPPTTILMSFGASSLVPPKRVLIGVGAGHLARQLGDGRGCRPILNPGLDATSLEISIEKVQIEKNYRAPNAVGCRPA